jgi:hypothetical protein
MFVLEGVLLLVCSKRCGRLKWETTSESFCADSIFLFEKVLQQLSKSASRRE